MSSGTSKPCEPEKIDGYEKYEIESAADTLIRAQELQKDAKLYKLACAKLQERADAANAAVTEANIEKKAAKNLKKVFG